MKGKKLNFWRVFLISLWFISSLSVLSSCDDSVGLGSQVDTSAPSVSISYPPAGAVIRDWFTVSGSCSDDISVALVNVSLTNTDTGATYDLGSTVPYVGTTWTITANHPGTAVDANGDTYTTYPLPDGQNYQITVTAYDYAGHSTTDKRAFAIDNTAPVVVLSAPSSFGTDTPKSFGRVLKLKGDFSETNTLATMEINVYEKPDTLTSNDDISLRTHLTFNNIDELSEYTIAKYFQDVPSDTSSDDYKLYRNYCDIYGEADVDAFRTNATAATKPFYVAFKFTDNARVYQSAGDGGVAVGNSATRYFIKTTEFEQNFTSSSATTPLTVSAMRQILNGTHSTYSRSSDIYTTLSASYSADYTAVSSDYTALANASTMSVNPKNNPTFAVASCAWADTQSASGSNYEYNFFKYVSGTPLTFTLTAGVDQDSLLLSDDTKPVVIWAVPVTVDLNATVAVKDPIITAPITVPENSADIPSTWIRAWTSAGKGLSNDTTYSAQATIAAEGGQVYKFVVTGEDTTGNSIEEANGTYAFYAYVDMAIPSLAIGDEDTSTNTNLAEGTIIPYYWLRQLDTDGLTPLTNKFKFSGTATPATNGITISEVTMSVVITDRTTGEEKTFSTTADVTYDSVYSRAASTPDHPAKWTAEITDNIPAANKGNYKYEFTFTTKDSKNNTASERRTIFVDYSAPLLTITNMADNDDIIVGSARSSYISETDNGDGTYTYKYSFRGKWSDTNGLGTDMLQYSTCADTSVASPVWSSWTTLTDETVPSEVTTEAGWSAEIVVTPGKKQGIKFRAIDKGGNIYENPSTVDLEFTNLDFDFDKPVITLDAIPSYTNSGNLTLKGTVTDALLDSITFTIKKDGVDKTSNFVTASDFTNIGASSKAFEINIPASVASNANDGSWTFSITATDEVGTSTTVTPVGPFYIDTIPPVWKENDATYPFRVNKNVYSYVDENDHSWYNSSTLPFSGAFVENGTDIDTVYYCIIEAGSSATVAYTDEHSFSTTKRDGGIESFNATLGQFITRVDTSNNALPNHIWFKAKDKAGNESTPISKDIYIDSESPNLESDQTGTQLSNKTLDITVSGNTTDDASGIASVVLKVTNSSTNAEVGTVNGSVATDHSTDTAWTATIPASSILSTLADATYSVKATVTDYAGNSSSSTIFKIQVDQTAPVVAISSPSSAAKLNGKQSISGTVREANSLKSFELFYTLQTPSTASFTEGTDPATSWVKIPHHDAGEYASIDSNYSTDQYTILKESDIANFSYTDDYKFDFTKLSEAGSAANGQDYVYILPVAIDSAGNCNIYTTAVGGAKTYSLSGQYSTYNVDMNSDRPTIKVTNLTESNGSYFLKYGTDSQISGSISDDDATSDVVVPVLIGAGKQIASVTSGTSAYTVTFADATTASFTYSNDGTTAVWQNAANGKTELTLATGDWIYTPADTDDGAKTVFFYVEDNSATDYTAENYGKFSIGNSVVLYEPYIQYKTSAAINGAAAIEYSSDSNSPSVYSTTVSPYKADGTSAEFFSGITQVTPDVSIVAGGSERRYVEFTISARDSSGIAGITADLYYTSNGTTTYVKRLMTAPAGTTEISGISLGATYTSYTNGFVSGASSTDVQWTTSKIAIDAVGTTEIPTGSLTLNVTAYDCAGLYGNQSYTFSVDNTAPTIKITNPASGDEVTGDVSIIGSATDTGNAGTDEVFWLIPTNTQVTTAAGKATEKAKLEYLNGLTWKGGTAGLADEATASQWQFDFDGEKNDLLKTYDTAAYAQNDDYGTTGIYTLPVYIKAVDELGNYSIKQDYILKHNPDADKPRVVFTYPTTRDYDSGETYVTLGGTIRTTGTAEIPSGTTSVGAVYYQIDEDGGTWTSTAAEGYGCGTIVNAYQAINSIWGTSYTSSDFPADKIETVGFADAATMNAWWGIKANGGASWNITLNSSNELDPPANSDDTRNVKLRACGINANGKIGAWTQGDNIINIHIDNAAPSISTVINQYSTTPSNTNLNTISPSATQSYEADMFLKGQWYLMLTILDESGISSVTVKEDSTSITNFYQKSYQETVNGKLKTGYLVCIPISYTNEGSVSYTVTATDSDGSAHVASQLFSFKIDNTAPSLDNLTGNDAELNSSNTIVNENGVYTLAGKSTDVGAGVERIVFYFMRKAGTTKTTLTGGNVIIDPMIGSTTDSLGSDSDDTKLAMSGLTKLDITQGSSTYNLYAKSVTGSNTVSTFTANSATASNIDEYVRTGGLIYIDGLYRLITDVSGSTITFEPETTTTSSSVTAYLPVAQVIDHTGEKTENLVSKPISFKTGTDDSDFMPESFSKSGTTWSWDASIQSDNMPDGPVTLVILAFDQAGNVSGTQITTTVSNNAPRIAKLYLATDLNSNSRFESNEFETYSIIGATGQAQEEYELTMASFDPGIFTVKDKLAVVPELTGGNGTIEMVAFKDASDKTAVKMSDTGAITTSCIADEVAASTAATTLTAKGTSSYSITADIFAAAKAKNSFHAYVLTNNELDGGTPTEALDIADRKFSFTFWDSTEETDCGESSQNAVVYVKDFTFDLVDGEAPKAVINPFYWKTLNLNSIYGSNDTANVTGVSKLSGHIELESDLTGTQVLTDLGADPKVSGKIVFTGTAYDEHSLASLSFTLSNGTVTPFSDISMATYSSSTSTWTASTASIDTEGYAVSVTDTEGDSYGVFEDSVYFGQKGHKIYWTLSIDTEKISTTSPVAEDMVLTVLATDLAGNSTEIAATKISAPTTSTGYIPGQELSDTVKYTVTDGTTNYPMYQIDIVPYVKEIKTSLTALKKKNPSVYTRTARGHYTVRSDETVTFSGFNLGSSTSLSIATLTTSGKYDFTIGGISAVNNNNNNNSRGCYATEISDASSYEVKNAYAYNRLPNNDNNNLLTDDIYFDIWEFDSDHVVPISGKIEQPVMKINPNNDKVGFAFVNGPLYFSMGGGTGNENYSYTYWMGSFDFFTSVGFTYDKLGYSYGVAAGGDINSNAADKFQLMTSRWGHASRGQSGSYSKSNSLRLGSIGQKGDSAGNNTDTNYFDKQRFQSPSLATAVHGTTTYLYMAYYDQMNDEIRFRYGSTNSTTTTDFGNFVDKETTNSPYTYAAGASTVVQMVAGSNTGRNAGGYVSIGVVSAQADTIVDDVVVMVWYDNTNRCLMYSYNDSPTENRAGNKTAAGWSQPVRVFAENTDFENAGEYCKLAVDNDGGVHIACYDPVNLDLDYAYLPKSKYGKTTNQSDFVTCVVDSNGVTGSNLTLDVAKVSSSWIPYIGYYMTSCIRPKLAYKVDTTSSAPAGSEDDTVTGSWEITIVPTSNTVEMQSNQHNDINVAVWKDDTGIMKKMLTTTSSSNSNYNNPSSYNSTSYGQIYGNGKTDSNGNLYPILGYAVKYGATGDHIETAQMK